MLMRLLSCWMMERFRWWGACDGGIQIGSVVEGYLRLVVNKVLEDNRVVREEDEVDV